MMLMLRPAMLFRLQQVGQNWSGIPRIKESVNKVNVPGLPHLQVTVLCICAL